MASAAEEVVSGAKGAIISPTVDTDGSSLPSVLPLPLNFIGGNRLEVARPGAVRDFVAANGGHTVITSVSYRSLRECTGEDRLIVVVGGIGTHRQQWYCCGQGD